jgi:glycosyltransferase involved in cell wall biosynthesis
MKKLAIVIPAYKASYFKEALDSLANQTCHDFTIYIGDDNSPEDLKSIADTFTSKLDISYTRFANNTGAEKLVLQWKRCVSLTKSEEWIWLFSDDDIAEPTCVDEFYKRINTDAGKFDVYRFNTAVINKQSVRVTDTPTGPLEESSQSMAYHLLYGRRGNSMPDHIFSRQIYDEQGGFVYTDYAQGADWAMSILFSSRTGIRIIEGSKLLWRYSGDNISSVASSKKDKMVNGHFQFVTWVINHFQYLKEQQGGITFEEMVEAARFNLVNVIINHYRGLSTKQYMEFAAFERKTFQLSYRKILADLLKIKKFTLSARELKILSFRRPLKLLRNGFR